jgi:RND family efflux transporter MFP subunit
MMDHGLAAAWRGALLACLGAGLLCGCDDSPPPAAEVRPVATVRVAYTEEPTVSEQVGEIRPHYESDLGFRIGGRIAERAVLLGQVLRTGEMVARLDPQDQRNQMVAAEADLAAAKASLVQAAAEEKRKVELHAGGWATAAALEAAQKAKASAAAGVSAAQAKLRLARDQLDYATLRAPADGAVTALGAEAGQVVGAGQMVVRFARLDRKEAVFALSQTVLHNVPEGTRVAVSLLDAPEVTTQGTISEIAPSADAVTRTYTVKVALPDAPGTMRLGMSVVGRIEAGTRRVAELPSSALFQDGGLPAVWVVDPASSTVSLSRVEVARLDAGTVRIASGVPEGARVVTAGVQTLRPGQTVRPDDGAGR